MLSKRKSNYSSRMGSEGNMGTKRKGGSIMAKPICDDCKWFEWFNYQCSQDNEPDIENHCKFYEEEE